VPRILTAAVLAAATAMLLAAGARAGSYHVYACRTPAGEAAPADGWSGSKTGTYSYAEDTCAQPGGALVAALGDQAARTANTDQATWAFGVPAGIKITHAVLWRAGDADGGAAINAFYEFWLAGPNDLNSPANTFSTCVGGSTCPSGVGDQLDPSSPENRLVVPSQNLGMQLYANASCAGETGFKCKEAQGDPNGYAAVVYLYASDITLEQAAGPTAGAVAGELASAPAVAGTSDIAFTASDPGAGVYAALFSVDGQIVQSTVLDGNGGRCRDVGEAGDGLPAFLYVQPCLASVSADVGLDTTRIANGAHHLVVDVMDAAGNLAPVLDRNITVANPTAGSGGPGAGAAQPGPPNGSPASAQAALALSWKGARSTRLVAGFGKAETVLGRLTGPGGVPIAGASIDVLATPSFAGARPAAMTAPHTAADGRFTLRIPPGVSSRTIAFAYRSHVGDALPVVTRTLTLTVRAALHLSITPHVASVGRRILFSGRLLGGPVPSSGKLLVLEAQSPGGPWIKFDVVRSTRAGRYRASYRFRFPGPANYRFRVVSEAEADYPFAAGSSNVVGVHER
jgi:hypothetical protein